MRKVCLVAMVICIWSIVGNAQNPSIQQTIEDLVESMNTEPDENTDLQDVIDDLYEFAQHPLNINSATKEELLRLHFLNEIKIDKLIEFRNTSGAIFSIYEMTAIDGFDKDLLQKMVPFISFGSVENNQKKSYADNDLFLRATRAFANIEEENPPEYEGSAERFYLRFKHVSADLEYGVVAEKDPGEAFFSDSNKQGFDYMGGYANLRIGKADQQIFVGDYHVMFGQGLVGWQGFSMGKSSETTNIFRSAQGIRSSASTDENQFFRGLAAKLKLGKFGFTPFISYRSLDSNIDTIEERPYFGAFQTSGYHRTNSELLGKDALKQFAGGASMNYSHRSWTFGCTGIYSRFDVEMERSDDLSNQFLSNGKETFVGGFNWRGTVKNIFIFGEAAASANSGKALMSGFMLKPAQNVELAAVYRNINKTYFSFFANTFTESSKANDEHGLYLGLKFFPVSRVTVNAYFDFFEYKWIKYTTIAPSRGIEYFVQLNYSLSAKSGIYVRYFQEEKGQKVTVDNAKYNELQKINRLRLHYSQQIGESLSLKTRVELSAFSKLNNDKGILMYQDIVFKPIDSQFSMNGRLAWFNTESYDSRLYAYENDVLYSFSVPALYGKGIRTYLNFRQNIGQKLAIWLKLAATKRFLTTEQIEAGDPDFKSEIKVQLRYQF